MTSEPVRVSTPQYKSRLIPALHVLLPVHGGVPAVYRSTHDSLVQRSSTKYGCSIFTDRSLPPGGRANGNDERWWIQVIKQASLLLICSPQSAAFDSGSERRFRSDLRFQDPGDRAAEFSLSRSVLESRLVTPRGPRINRQVNGSDCPFLVLLPK